ncbi:hypothetical protein PTTG_02473 [Puccinia triticina 1-1 BBBD Race 1]|uniref:DUF1708 domain-containing protein n=1 Tax=Puccinia triticina (isolate 1-1 / race 1 (BBBD)) TaxID=630390 RepID=A0A180H3K6_PUCT1|nr:hypothetical protein PTTG_02473 [Puccinia triticina 1-1 BBBD Race 1]
MHSFFKSRSLKNKLSPNPPPADRIPATHPAPDELGRPSAPPLFTSQSASSSDQLSRSGSQTFPQPDAELQLIYGYIGLFTEIELDLPTAARAANLVAQELKARALETPLLFSTHALDISTESTHSLIRGFVNNQRDFNHDLTMHSPHNLAALLKWILCRYVNGRGGHGFLQWEQYASWRESEKAFGYPPRFLSTHLVAHMSAPAASLLTCLLDLFASASVRADLTGMTVHKCGALFGAYIFGLEDDKPFEQTYSHWLRQAHATEHLILAHMRDLKAQSPTGKLPLRMESSIQGYPSIIPSLIKTHPSARLERVARFQRLTSFYNKNLIYSAGTWNVARSRTWDRLKPYPEIGAAQYLNHSKAGFSTDPSKLLLSPSYKHLLNIKGQLNLDNEEDDYGANFEGPQRFKTLVEKEWSGFMNRGFQEPDAKKLQFNLDESSNAKMKMKRETMDWDSFTGAGFIGRETYQPADLDFNTNISNTPPPRITPPLPKKGISKKLIKNSRSPSVFAYDTTPIELPSLFVDENFFEAWADVLVSSGWCHDELKEVSWVLIHCKCKPADYQEFEFRPTPLNPDGRNDDMWALFEEVVPAEYQAAQTSAQLKVACHKNNRRSFLRAITRKDNKRSANGSSSEKAATIQESSINYYPLAPQSQAPSMSASLSQSSSNYQVDSSSEYSSSQAASTAPQTGHAGVGLFRSLSKMIQGGHTPAPARVIRHPAHLHTFNTNADTVDELDPSHFQKPTANQPEPWVNVPGEHSPARSINRPVLRSVASSDTTRGMGTSHRLHGSKSQPFERPANPTPPASDRRASSSTVSSRDFAPSADHEGLVHDGSHSSAVSRSIASSSDFTVELVERIPEGAASHLLRPPSLIPIKSINNPALSARKPPPIILPSDPMYSESPAYHPSNGLLTPRDGAFQPSQTHAPMSLSPTSAYSPAHPVTSSPALGKLSYNHISPQQKNQHSDRVPEQARLEQQKLLQQQRQRLEQLRDQPQGIKPQQQPTGAEKEQQPLIQESRPTPPPEPYHPQEQLHLADQPEEKARQQPPQKQKEGPPKPPESRFAPAFFKSALRKVELHSSVSSVGSFESPGNRDEDWQLSLRKSVSPLSPIVNNHHFSTGPILPPQFDIKAKKVSNIVDLFEKAQPDSPPRDADSYSISSYSTGDHRATASPIRIPVRSLKLSRVGEQEEK